MKNILLSAVSLACLSSASYAADRLALKLSPSEMYTIAVGLGALDGSQHIVTNAMGKETSVVVPFKLGEARLTIAHDQAVLNARLTEFRDAVRKDAKAAAELENVKTEVDGLLSISVSDLNLSANDVPASALAAIAPICPTCVGLEEPKTPAGSTDKK